MRYSHIPPLLLERTTSGAVANTARIGTPVLGSDQWRKIADAENWLLGGGSPQLAWWGPRTLAAGATTTFRSYIWPRRQNSARLWCFAIRCSGGEGTFPVNDGTKVVTVQNNSGGLQYVYVAERVSDSTPAGEAVANTLSWSSGSSAALITSVTLSELPATNVAIGFGTNGLGISPGSCSKWAPIQDREDGGAMGDQRFSVAGVMRTAQALVEGGDAFRRCKLFEQFLTSGVNAASTSFVNLNRIDPSAQTRKISTNIGGTRSCSLAVYAASTGTGEVRIASSASGASTTVTVNSSTPQWWTTGTIGLAVDDFNEDMWLAGGSRETLTIEHRNVSGTLTTYGVCVGEE